MRRTWSTGEKPTIVIFWKSFFEFGIFSLTTLLQEKLFQKITMVDFSTVDHIRLRTYAWKRLFFRLGGGRRPPGAPPYCSQNYWSYGKMTIIKLVQNHHITNIGTTLEVHKIKIEKVRATFWKSYGERWVLMDYQYFRFWTWIKFSKVKSWKITQKCAIHDK